VRCLRCGNNANFDTPKGGKLVEIRLIDKVMGDCHPTPAQQKAWDQSVAAQKVKAEQARSKPE
jgi:hypothetical protein